ncbi:MAG: cation:dicarboxylase symporter family transporter, partial [Sulfurospirillaceae bacterium]|nr:cation:dicarboxylase symporter family transporter [Sulfurospirillaceae bacterium]
MKQSSLIKNTGIQILVAMVIGTLVGVLMGENAVIFKPLGDIFIHLIKMLVIPLVAFSMISGAANLGDSPTAGKLGLYTILFFLITSAVAVASAIFSGIVFQPGVGIDLSSVEHMFSNKYAAQGALPTAMETIIGMIPVNIFKSLGDANILQILIFCLFFGVALSKLSKESRTPLINGLEGIIQALIWMVKVVMYIAPIGVFGLMAESIGTFGFNALVLVMKLFVVYTGTILFYGFVFYPIMIKLFSTMPVMKFISVMKKPQTVALSTASSMATLPVTIETCEVDLKVSKST